MERQKLALLNCEASEITNKAEHPGTTNQSRPRPVTGDGLETQTLSETADQMERVCDDVVQSNAALESLLSLARPRLLRLVALRMSNRMGRRLDAEDIVQETLVTAARRFDEFKANRRVPVFVWLRGLAIERIIEANRQHLGAAKRSLRREESKQQWLNHSSSELLKQWALDSKSPSQIISDRQRADDLKQALQELPENYREIIVLRFFESLTIAETAASIGCTVSNAKVLQFRALKRLEKTMLESLGWGSADRKL